MKDQILFKMFCEQRCPLREKIKYTETCMKLCPIKEYMEWLEYIKEEFWKIEWKVEK